jgi:prephenate dehydratase
VRVVGFQGLRGAYSEMAIHQHFGSEGLKVKPLPSFEAAFTALSEARLSDILLPFENSLAGMIHENYDHLARFPVTIVGETVLEIQHCLLLPPRSRLDEIHTVISHPQALAQCSEYIRRQGWTAQNFFDTAGAAEHLGQAKTPGVAAIASAQAAKLYGLKVGARQIADRGENFTRFLHLRRPARKTVALPEGPGRVLSLLLLQAGEGFGRIGPLCGILQSLGIELNHCEARPTKDAAWTYYYYLELAAGPTHPSWELALQTLSSLTRTLKVLGSYRAKR